MFLYFLVNFEKVNFPRYILHHMIWALKKSQEDDRLFIPYGRLISEIFYQGGLLSALKSFGVVSDNYLGTMTGKYINGSTVRSMGIVKIVVKLKSDLQESMIVSDLMVDFPPISKEDNNEVLEAYVTNHYEKTREIINFSYIPNIMAGTPLRINKKRKSKKTTSEAVEVLVSEPKPKKAKKAKAAPQVNVAEPILPTIQEEVEDLEPVKILDKRTRGGTSVGSSEAVSAQPKPRIHKKRRCVRKMKVSDYVWQEEEVKARTDLISRAERRKKANVDQEGSLVEKSLTVAN